VGRDIRSLRADRLAARRQLIATLLLPMGSSDLHDSIRADPRLDRHLGGGGHPDVPAGCLRGIGVAGRVGANRCCWRWNGRRTTVKTAVLVASGRQIRSAVRPVFLANLAIIGLQPHCRATSSSTGDGAFFRLLSIVWSVSGLLISPLGILETPCSKHSWTTEDREGPPIIGVIQEASEGDNPSRTHAGGCPSMGLLNLHRLHLAYAVRT